MDLRSEASAVNLECDSFEFASKLDAEDELRSYRDAFHFPDGATYLCGNSLGLAPKKIKETIVEDLDRWAKFGVEGHFQCRNQVLISILRWTSFFIF